MGIIYKVTGSDIWLFPDDGEDEVNPDSVIVVEATATTLKAVIMIDGVEASVTYKGTFSYETNVLGKGFRFATKHTNGLMSESVLTYGSEKQTEIYLTPLPVVELKTFNYTEESLVKKFQGDDVFIGEANTSHYVRGFGGNDRFTMTYGDEYSVKFDGGDGIDTAIILSNSSFWRIEQSDFLWSPSGFKSGYVVIDERLETPNQQTFGHHLDLIDVERIQFNDISIALDIEGPSSAGAVYRLYQAALGRTPDKEGLGYWIDAMDKGLNLTSMSYFFIESEEFKQNFGSAIDDESFVALLYNNILGRQPEKAGFDYWVDVLQKGHERAEILPGFSESAENQLRVIGDIEGGFEYQLWLG